MSEDGGNAGRIPHSMPERLNESNFDRAYWQAEAGRLHEKCRAQAEQLRELRDALEQIAAHPHPGLLRNIARYALARGGTTE